MSALITKMRAAEVLPEWPVRMQKCASKECDRSGKFWRRAKDEAATVRLHGSGFCFPHCFEREFERVLEQRAPALPAACLRSRRMPLGLLMLSRGNLTEQQLRQALHAQLTAGSGRIGEWLRRLGFAGDSDIASALAQQWSCPVIKTLPAQIPDCPVPRRLLRTLRMAPVHVSKSSRLLHLAFAGNIAYKALFSIEQMLDAKTEACLTTEKEIASALDRLGDGSQKSEKFFENCQGAEETVRIVCSYTGALDAKEVRSFACGDFLWVRILAVAQSSDLLFPQVETRCDVVPAS